MSVLCNPSSIHQKIKEDYSEIIILTFCNLI